jgi:hypothetical protein
MGVAPSRQRSSGITSLSGWGLLGEADGSCLVRGPLLPRLRYTYDPLSGGRVLASLGSGFRLEQSILDSYFSSRSLTRAPPLQPGIQALRPDPRESGGGGQRPRGVGFQGFQRLSPSAGEKPTKPGSRRSRPGRRHRLCTVPGLTKRNGSRESVRRRHSAGAVRS